MKALLSVAFGTSFAATREKTIDAVEAKLAAAFSERIFYSAWTSGRIVAKLRAERGEHHDTLPEVFARLSADGVDDLVVASMCLMHGNEMRKIRDAACEWVGAEPGRVARVAAPLLDSAADRAVLARAVCEEFSQVPETDALLLMGHGSQDAPRERAGRPFDANAVYAEVQQVLHELGKRRFFVATVEGAPVLEDAFGWLEECGAARVHLAPFMMVAGDHATNDLAGKDADSWKSRLEARGFQTEVVLRGLGEYAGVQQLVCEHARDAQPVVAGGAEG